ncbi:GNAT family N-acetyltransferase [Radicibacter daui]|uniref:GNAT family N-acetyltransferase n=1 Tax=Radicibacter daui TaxID=3064829 RepID=UPI004046B4B4
MTTQDKDTLGTPVDFKAPPPPARVELAGRYVLVEPLDPARHLAGLSALALDLAANPTWDYLAYGPFESAAAYEAHLRAQAASTDPLFFVFRNLDADGAAQGIASFLRITEAQGTIEIGHVWFSPALQRTRAATEGLFLLARYAFDLGYRRLEWKCNALNAASKRAAERLGYSYEGTFRQMMVVKGRNRDTAWYSIIDGEWPAIKARFEQWLAESNFDSRGRQLSALRTR